MSRPEPGPTGNPLRSGAPPAAAARPGWLAFATDPARAVAEFGALLTVAAPLLACLPKGDGGPVLVLPGLGQSDLGTRPLRRVLRSLGYHVHGWRLGRNIGPTGRTVDGLPVRVREIAERHGRPISVIGWSLGGIYARRLARRYPDAVGQVITLGSPFRLASDDESRAGALFRLCSNLHVERWELPLEEGEGPLPVPATSVYSPIDGIVAWPSCLDVVTPKAENIGVLASHFGLGHHPAVLVAIADRLAQPPGRWRPYRPPGPLRPLYLPASWPQT